jgi:DNA-binding NtrC family response regulator
MVDRAGGGSGETTAQSSPPTLERVRVRRLRMVMAPPGQRLCTVPLHGDVQIGREGHVAEPLALADSEVSRRHAAVEVDPATGSCAITDLGSRNGTFVNGARLAERRVLADGDVLRVGRALFVVQDLELRRDEPLVTGGRLLGPSVALQRVRAAVARVAPKSLPVLITGETGVGKELVAEEIHAASGRAGALVALNCAAIPETLAESELFGHAAGAFTGATGRSGGLFRAADGGTLFLDEIGEMPLELQPKLLRALAKGEVRSVGGAETARVDVRIVAATNRDVRAAGSLDLRPDLLARLAGVTIHVPPLRERREDILHLAEVFLRAHTAASLSVDAAEALLLHDWPHNVRELEQTMAAAGAAGGDAITCDHLPAPIAARLGPRLAGPAASGAILGSPADDRRPPSRDELADLLTRFEGNVARVAQLLRCDRRQVYRWAARHRIELDGFRPG